MTRSVYTAKYKLMREMLADLRNQSGLSQAALAERLGVNQTYVSKYELGERRLDIVEFFEIAEAIGFDALEFLRDWQDRC